MNKRQIVAGLVALVLLAVVVVAALSMAKQPVVAPPQTQSEPSQVSNNQRAVQPSGSSSQTVVTGDQKVDMINFAYSPAQLTVKKGATVTWTNQDNQRHDVALDDGQPAGGPKSPLLGKGESYSFTFNTVGTYNYHCTPHPFMKASVTVVE